MSLSLQKPTLLYWLALLLSSQALLLYGLPWAALLTIWILLAIVFLFAGGAQALLTAASLAACALLLNFVIYATGLERGIYYRPQELLSANDPDFGGIYRPNTQLSMNTLFGDLEAMGKAGVKEPHETIYRTDSLGFRNPADYHGQQFVLVGDSLAAGANDTQSCLLTEWLRQDHKIDTYNLGFPGDMNDYVNRSKAFQQRHGHDFKTALFVFEGNDFVPYTGRTLPQPGMIERYYNLFKSTSLWRYTRSLYKRSSKKQGRHEGDALVQEIGGQKMVFFRQYVAVTNNRTVLEENALHFVPALQALKPNITQIFFIPTKYRVYAQWLSGEPLPNEQWQYLQHAAQQAGVPVHDLTPVLQAEAVRLLPQGQYVYWRDDTHWNCNGMRVAATEVARVLSSHQP